jgi:hypothetical protein
MSRNRSHPGRAAVLALLLLAGCAPPYLRTDMPEPRRASALDALASLVGACGAPSPGEAGPDAPEPTPAADGRERRRCRERADGGEAPTPVGPTQKKP